MRCFPVALVLIGALMLPARATDAAAITFLSTLDGE
jgi:hypothetical protein